MGEHLPPIAPIDQHADDVLRYVARDSLLPDLDGWTARHDRVLDDRPQFDRSWIYAQSARLDAAVAEQILHQVAQPRHAAAGRAEHLIELAHAMVHAWGWVR